MSETKKNQTYRALSVLTDYDWHSSLEFVRLQRPILSYTRRIFELRQMGHNIKSKQVGHIHFYRLVKP